MAQQQPEKDYDKLKRIKTKKQQQFTALPDYPAERCPKQPDRIDMPLSMKFVKKRRINMKRKYRAVLENGIFQLHNPKQTELNAFSIEYRIDLAKVVLLYDDQRLAVQLQKEVLLLYPITMSLEKFRHWMHQHRLWSQQKAAETGQARSDDDPAPRSSEGPVTPQQDTSDRSSIRAPKTTTSASSGGQMTTNVTDYTTDPTISSVYSNPMYEYLRAVHATQLAVLDVTSRNLEEQVQLAEEMKEFFELLKKTREQPTVPVQKPAPPPSVMTKEEKKPDDEEEEDEEEEEGETTAIPPAPVEEKK